MATKALSHNGLQYFCVAFAATLQQFEATDRVGTHFGPYKLLEKIGEGGMGLVYMAEQKQPVRRTVALKVIKPGMDSHQVVARFESERQALALMNHPNIARVLDVGTTDAALPYFVMELVKGIAVFRNATNSIEILQNNGSVINGIEKDINDQGQILGRYSTAPYNTFIFAQQT